MNDPAFNIGDRVECESISGNVTPSLDHGEPRWNFDKDQEGSGEYMQGTVDVIDPISYYVTVKFDNLIMRWSWPLSGNKQYHANQWERPGYLRHIVRTTGEYDIIRHPGKWRLVDKGTYTTLEKIK